MKKFYLILFLMGLLHSVVAQNINPDPYNNRIVLKYYKPAELRAAETQDYEKFKWIKYYYIHSFILDSPATLSCDNYSAALVDIKDYESYRLPNRRVTVRNEECGYYITLLSQRELDIMIHNDSEKPEIKPDEK
jgi:hypothetical protein